MALTITDGLRPLPPLTTTVAIVGGGIAGVWLGLKLVRAGVDTTLVTYQGTDRGGVQGSSARSAGAINTTPIEHTDFRHFLDHLSQGQAHPMVAEAMATYLPEELAEICTLTHFKKIKLGVALASGGAAPFMRQMYSLFHLHGGQILDAWVTRLVADQQGCGGIQYQQDGAIGKLRAPIVVIASGGYTGLFDGSVTTNNYGAMLGRFIQSGGTATNLEFVFKHGYGKPDYGALTPTEELPGAEVYDSDGNHVTWLEKELFEGRGTANHLEAFKHWRRHNDKTFFIDLSLCDAYKEALAYNRALAHNLRGSVNPDLAECIDKLASRCPQTKRYALTERLRALVSANAKISYEIFNELKPLFREMAKGEVFRVRQIAYFSMGGIAHRRFATYLPNVYVTGEAMHDFGAHRVGGLPWGLYLAAGRIISEGIVARLRSGDVANPADFDLIQAGSAFDADLLQELRSRLYRHQESHFNVPDARRFIAWLRGTRRRLQHDGGTLDDAVAWLLVAEAVMAASVCREESRGCFYRADHPAESELLGKQFTSVSYDVRADKIFASLRPSFSFNDVQGQDTGTHDHAIIRSRQ